MNFVARIIPTTHPRRPFAVAALAALVLVSCVDAGRTVAGPDPLPAAGPLRVSVSATCVDINSAGLTDLVRIVHITESRGRELIAKRPYASLDDLTRIKGIGSRQVREIKAQGLACVSTAPPQPAVAPIEVSVLNVGQGDAIWIENGTTRVLIDGGQSMSAMASFIQEKQLAGTTIDYMIVSHAHIDHYGGLREFFLSKHNITIRRLYENGDASSATTLRALRDSVAARAARGQLTRFDTDNACGTGAGVCTHSLAGGARMHILRPLASGSVNDRSVGIKLIGPDSASFTMWLSGDAEHAAMQHFRSAYGVNPGLAVHVLKGNHHGSCNGVNQAWLDALRPRLITFGVSASNSYGHVHEQTKQLLRAASYPWLRSDGNGRITLRSAGTAGSGYTVTTERSGTSLDGAADRAASSGTRQRC
jgi:competence protein ComEC